MPSFVILDKDIISRTHKLGKSRKQICKAIIYISCDDYHHHMSKYDSKERK